MTTQEMKEFNRSAQEFFSHRKEESSSKIHQSLLMIAANWKDSFFESDDFLVIHSFLSNLQKVLVYSERLPDLSSEAVDVLRRVSSTPSVREYLTRSFNFMPVLTKQLARTVTDSDESNQNKVLGLLELMQEVTYGIKIQWQESYLQLLTSTLKDLVCGKYNDAIVAAALGVLVNLCHGNQTVVGVITRITNVKKLLRTILKSHKQSDSRIRVEVSKLIIVLGEEVTEAELEMECLMKATSPSLVEALRLRNASRMRHILAFLEEIVKSRKLGIFLRYSDCKNEIAEMLSVIESDEVPLECLAVLLRYFTVLIGCEAKTGDIWEFSVTLFRLALSQASKRRNVKDSLTLAAAIVSRFLVDKQTKDGGSNAECIFASLVENLPMLLSFLEVSSLNVEVCERLSALMTLLSASLKIVSTRDIVQNFELSTFRTLFETLKKPELKNDNLFHASIYTFYVKTLTFLSELSDKEASWLLLFNQLLLEEDVQVVLSVALYTGTEDMKKQVLGLTVTAGFSPECLAVMAKCMAKVNNLIVFSPAGQAGSRMESRPKVNFEYGLSDVSTTAMFQESRLEGLLEKVERTLSQNDCPPTSSVIELYQVKVASLVESANRLEEALEASDAHASALRQDLALAQVEFTRLHNLLPCQELAIEEAKKEKARLVKKITEAETKSCREIKKLKLELEELTSKLNAQEKASVKNEEALKKQLSECKKEVDSKLQQIEQLKKDIINQSNQMANLKKHLNMISELSRKDI